MDAWELYRKSLFILLLKPRSPAPPAYIPAILQRLAIGSRSRDLGCILSWDTLSAEPQTVPEASLDIVRNEIWIPVRGKSPDLRFSAANLE